MTQMIEVIEKNIKTVILTINYMFKKVEMLKYPKRDGVYVLKMQIKFEESKKLNLWDEKYAGWDQQKTSQTE